MLSSTVRHGSSRGSWKTYPILALLPASAAMAGAHTGVINVRTGPEPSDIALFVCAAAGVWLVRRAMRKRFRRD